MLGDKYLINFAAKLDQLLPGRGATARKKAAKSMNVSMTTGVNEKLTG